MSKLIHFGSMAVLVIVFLCFNVQCGRIDTNEYAFWYSNTQKEVVSRANNPELTNGLTGGFGFNTCLFRVTKGVVRYTFEGQAAPYNDSLEWDSKEGVGMVADWTLAAQVEDAYLFFQHFGENQYEYKSKDLEERLKDLKDLRLYECLRQLGLYAAVVANEVNAKLSADEIQRDPDAMRKTMLAKLQAHAKQFGVAVHAIEFPSRFRYPAGDLIEKGRQQLAAVDTELKAKVTELATVKAQASNNRQMAAIEAKKLTGEATARANARSAETDQLVNALASSIQNIGVEGTFRLEMARMQRKLIEQGAMPTVVLTEESILAKPFYSNGLSQNPPGFKPKIPPAPVSPPAEPAPTGTGNTVPTAAPNPQAAAVPASIGN